MPNTYTLIASNTLSTATASVTFSSIPATYTDLLVKISARNTGSEINGIVYVQPNAATTNLSGRLLYGTGSAAGSASYTSDPAIWGYCCGDTSTASTFSSSEFYIPNYAGSTYKSISVDSVSENNATDARASLMAGLWSDTTAITSLKFLTADNSAFASKNFKQYSTFYLYGIKNS